MFELLSNPVFAGCGTAIFILVAVFAIGSVWYKLRDKLDRHRPARDAIQIIASQELGSLDVTFYTVWCSKDASTANVVVDISEESLLEIQAQVSRALREKGFTPEIHIRTFEAELANPGPHIESILLLHKVTTCPHDEDPGQPEAPSGV